MVPGCHTLGGMARRDPEVGVFLQRPTRSLTCKAFQARGGGGEGQFCSITAHEAFDLSSHFLSIMTNGFSRARCCVYLLFLVNLTPFQTAYTLLRSQIVPRGPLPLPAPPRRHPNPPQDYRTAPRPLDSWPTGPRVQLYLVLPTVATSCSLSMWRRSGARRNVVLSFFIADVLPPQDRDFLSRVGAIRQIIISSVMILLSTQPDRRKSFFLSIEGWG